MTLIIVTTEKTSHSHSRRCPTMGVGAGDGVHRSLSRLDYSDGRLSGAETDRNMGWRAPEHAPGYGRSRSLIGPRRAPITHSVPCPERQPTLIDNSKQEKSSRPNRTKKVFRTHDPGKRASGSPCGLTGLRPSSLRSLPQRSRAGASQRCPATPGGRAVSRGFHLVPELPCFENY
jgi:hypothetical protein